MRIIMSNYSSIKLLAIGFTVGCVISYLTSQFLPVTRKSSHEKAFYLGVKIVFPTIETKETFINDFTPIAEYVRKYEPTTISYELLLSDKDKLQIYILERYVNKQAYLEIHKKSNEFLTFREKFQKLINDGAKVDGESYVETNIGFV